MPFLLFRIMFYRTLCLYPNFFFESRDFNRETEDKPILSKPCKAGDGEIPLLGGVQGRSAAAVGAGLCLLFYPYFDGTQDIVHILFYFHIIKAKKLHAISF